MSKVQLLVTCNHKGRSASTRYVDGKYVPHAIANVRFSPVAPHNTTLSPEMEEEVKQFFEATPSGSIEFNTVNDAAAEVFEPGKMYRVTMEPVETESE